MIKYICDKCGGEIFDELFFSRNIKGTTFHYCTKCAAELMADRNEPEPHPAPKPIPDKPKPKKKPNSIRVRKLTDDKISTLRSLWEANKSGRRAVPFTPKQMAEEVGCTETTVNNYIKLFESGAIV